MAKVNSIQDVITRFESDNFNIDDLYSMVDYLGGDVDKAMCIVGDYGVEVATLYVQALTIRELKEEIRSMRMSSY